MKVLGLLSGGPNVVEGAVRDVADDSNEVYPILTLTAIELTGLQEVGENVPLEDHIHRIFISLYKKQIATRKTLSAIFPEFFMSMSKTCLSPVPKINVA